MAECVDIAARWEPLVDSFLMERLDGAQRRLHAPVRREIVLEMNQPHEGVCSACYHNLLRDESGVIRMYYRGHTKLADGKDLQTANLAVSRDGIRFDRPRLGVCEVAGSRDNNIVWAETGGHNFCVFRDANPACRAEERYKAVGGEWEKLYGFVSPDGIRWRRLQDPPLPIPGKFDSLNVPFWDARIGQYRLFSRCGYEGVRAVQSCTSEDFLHWTDPQPHQYPPGTPVMHLYTNATVPCPGAEHILLSFPKRFVPDRTVGTEGMVYPGTGLSDAIFMASRDGLHWDRTFLEAWMTPGPDRRNWTHRGNMPGVGIFETAEGEWSMYISEHYGWPTARLRRLTLRRMGIASVRAGAGGGQCVTRPITFAGRELRLNYATSVAGSIRVEVQDLAGGALPGRSLADMDDVFGDEFDRPVRWKDGRDLSDLIGKPVRLRFALRDADLFALRVVG